MTKQHIYLKSSFSLLEVLLAILILGYVVVNSYYNLNITKDKSKDLYTLSNNILQNINCTKQLDSLTLTINNDKKIFNVTNNICFERNKSLKSLEF